MTTILKVEGMSCEHCVKAVKQAVSAIEGVASVDVDLAGGTVTVDYSPDNATIEAIKNAIEEEGYSVRTAMGSGHSPHR